MIIYFSGTGNSRAVASLLGECLGERVMPLTSESPRKIGFEGGRLVLVCPVYGWGIPPIVLSYINSLSDRFRRDLGSGKIYVVLTCGDDTGLAPEMIENAFSQIGMSVAGIWSVQMPNNYVLLPGFDVDSTKVESEKLSAFAGRVRFIAGKILENCGNENDCVRGSFPWFKTKIIYPLFMRFGMVPSRWRSSDACIGCRRCVGVCPVRNVGFDKEHRHPVWGKDCVSCLGCYHICPVHAVEYGKSTLKKGQYFFPASSTHKES